MTEARTGAQEFTWALLRIVVGLAFMSHGLSKLFGWLGGFGGPGEAAELMSRFGVAGGLETFGGLRIVLGLYTRGSDGRSLLLDPPSGERDLVVGERRREGDAVFVHLPLLLGLGSGAFQPRRAVGVIDRIVVMEAAPLLRRGRLERRARVMEIPFPRPSRESAA